MCTVKQHEANRLNAEHSTGPRSAAGKAVSSLNALTSGLYASTSRVLPGESLEDRENLVKRWHDQYRPVTAQALALVDDAIRHTWALQRFDRIEVGLLEKDLTLDDPRTMNFYLRLRRSIDLAHRALHRSINRLDDPTINLTPEQLATRAAAEEARASAREAKADATVAPAAPPPPPQPVESETVSPENGSVPDLMDKYPAAKLKMEDLYRRRIAAGEILLPNCYQMVGLPVPPESWEAARNRQE